jgi:O-antigen/teichoic acid export membrane protein
LLTLAALYAVIRSKGDLPSLVLAFAFPPVIIGVINLVYLVRKEMPWLKPRFHQVSKSALRRLSSTSTPLFLFQIGALLVNETQFIVLAHVTSLKLVSEYSILWRLAVTCASLVALGTGAFIPAFREAHERGDPGWMKVAFRRMLFLRMSMAVTAALTLFLGGNIILRFWLHRGDFQGIFLISTIWVTSFSDFLTIMDRIWIQVALVLINGATTIALTLVLAPKWGLLGAIVSIGFVTVCFWTWLIPLLVRPIFAPNSPIAQTPKSMGEDVVI